MLLIADEESEGGLALQPTQFLSLHPWRLKPLLQALTRGLLRTSVSTTTALSLPFGLPDFPLA